MIGHVTHCVTSRDLWHMLQSLFQSQSKARVIQLKLQLQTTKKGDLTIDEYFLKMRSYADNLAAVGKLVNDEDLIMHILGGFGPNFDAVVVNLTNRADSFTLPEVQYALQAHEARLQSQLSTFTHSAHFAQFNGGHGSAEMTYDRGRGVVDFNPDRGGPFRGRGDYSYDSAQEEAFYAQQLDSQWYASSGATAHLTNDLSNLQPSSPYSGSELLQVWNGNVLSIAHIGDSNSIPPDSNKPLQMNNVSHVSDITKNLICISKFTLDNNVFVELHSSFCCVKDLKTHQVLMKGALVKGLYHLDLSAMPTFRKQPSCDTNVAYHISSSSADSSVVLPINKSDSLPKCLVSCNTDVNEWHGKLGHPNSSVMQQVCNALHIKYKESSLLFCKACKIGKLHQTPHVSLPLKTTAHFQIIYSDLWGSAATPSSTGYKFYIYFIADYSRFTWIFPLHTKSEATTL
ncbi:hypothetical protein C2S51_038197 [Perilla frutescens var. frutescens]|nr:hypothetical protein C2S51_038197 [Perilla frutescens var. frutescens]